MNTTPRHTRISTALALAIIAGVIGAIVYALLIRSAIPARGMTITPILVATAAPAPTATTTPELIKYYLALISPRYRADPVQSSCVAPGPCKTQEAN